MTPPATAGQYLSTIGWAGESFGQMNPTYDARDHDQCLGGFGPWVSRAQAICPTGVSVSSPLIRLDFREATTRAPMPIAQRRLDDDHHYRF